MTCNTSAVAVCCSSASCCSVSSRVFSMAITACAAKLSSRGNLGFGKRARFPAKDRDEANHGAVLEQRNLQKRADAAQFDQGVAHTGGGRQEFIGH